jgi:hypothetical protein
MSGLGATINQGIQNSVVQQKPTGWDGIPTGGVVGAPGTLTPEQAAAQKQAAAQAEWEARQAARQRAQQGAVAAGSMNAWLNMTTEQQNQLLQQQAAKQQAATAVQQGGK